MKKRRKLLPSRDPGQPLKDALRREVNFGCPVRYPDGSGCGCPILTYHHFDPPWAGHFVHNPDGMIALCKLHHDQADGGAWTRQQLRAMKRSPYVDDAMKVAWPYQMETLVVKVGRSLVVGSGSALRLNGSRAISFRPASIAGLGVRTVVFDADVRDVRGNHWLNITDNWFKLDLLHTTNLEFTPQAKTFRVRHGDTTFVSLTYKRKELGEFLNWAKSFIDKENIAEGLPNSLESVGAIDGEGCVPIMEFEGRFRTPELELNVKGDTMRMRSFIPGQMQEFTWHSWVVNESCRVAIKVNGREVFSLG